MDFHTLRFWVGNRLGNRLGSGDSFGVLILLEKAHRELRKLLVLLDVSLKTHVVLHQFAYLLSQLLVVFLGSRFESFFVESFYHFRDRLENKIVNSIDVFISFQLNYLILQSVNDMIFLNQLLLEGKILIIELIILFLLTELAKVVHLLEYQILFL